MAKGKLSRLLGKSIGKVGKGMAGLGKLAVDQVDTEKNGCEWIMCWKKASCFRRRQIFSDGLLLFR